MEFNRNFNRIPAAHYKNITMNSIDQPCDLQSFPESIEFDRTTMLENIEMQAISIKHSMQSARQQTEGLSEEAKQHL